MHTSFRHIALLLAIAALGSGAQPRAGAAEKEDKWPVIIAPPPAMPQKVTVPRGRKIDIPLCIYGRQREQLRYLIKTPPVHGKLSEPRAIERESSIVTYEPPDLAVTGERSTFSVQISAGVSARVEVAIANASAAVDHSRHPRVRRIARGS